MPVVATCSPSTGPDTTANRHIEKHEQVRRLRHTWSCSPIRQLVPFSLTLSACAIVAAISHQLADSTVPQVALLTALAIELTALSPSVKIFSEEKPTYYCEAASGHNRLAYYLCKVLSTLPRMVVANLHFTVLLLLLLLPSTAVMSFGAAFASNQLYFYCIHRLASVVSMLVHREDGPLLATMGSLMVGVLSGVSPSLATVAAWRMGWLWRGLLDGERGTAGGPLRLRPGRAERGARHGPLRARPGHAVRARHRVPHRRACRAAVSGRHPASVVERARLHWLGRGTTL